MLHADVCAGTSLDAANLMAVTVTGLCIRGDLLSWGRRKGLKRTDAEQQNCVWKF